MATTTTRSDIRTRVRDYIYEDTADIISDAKMNRLVSEEIRSLPGKEIYLEDRYTTTTVANQTDYDLPTGTKKIERIERNDGTSTSPEYCELKGWDVYKDTLIFNFNPVGDETIMVYIKKAFTNPSDDVTYLDVPDEVCEVVVWGVVVRCYRLLIGYMRQAKNFDSISKPEGVTLSSMQGWLRDAEKTYKDLVSQYQSIARPRDIDLVS
jgi:hypothetical protein